MDDTVEANAPDARTIKISTVIAVYNAERTIAEAVESALMQEVDDHEIIIVNDGSTDATASILGGRYGNRIRVLTQRNCGAAQARNRGVRASKGKYVAFLDSDDLWRPGKLKVMVSALERNPLASLAFSEHTKFKDGIEYGTSEIGHAPSMKELMESWLPPIITSTWVVNRDIFERTGGYCEVFKGAQGYEDSWMLMLLRELGEFVYVPEKLTLYRVRESGESADKYAPGLPIFIALAKSRYGSRSRALIRSARNLHCRWLLSKAAQQMNRGNRLGAVATLGRIAWLRPAYFFGAEFSERLALPQNMKRLRDLTVGQRISSISN